MVERGVKGCDRVRRAEARGAPRRGLGADRKIEGRRGDKHEAIGVQSEYLHHDLLDERL